VDFFKKVFTPLSSDTPGDTARVSAGQPSGWETSEAGAFHRKSIGLGHFFDSFPDAPHLEILDLGGILESNVNYLSRMGCRIHAFDLLPNYDRYRENLPGRRFDPETARDFVEEYFRFQPEHFHAVFAWDCLEYLDSDVLQLTVSRLAQVMRPAGPLLSFFHTQSRGEVVPVHRYQIEDAQTLLLRTRQSRPLPSTFNNRGLERLFGGFESIKFFLTRDSLREVIVLR
jgi:hypothetical protein